jgi:hypothetical protein
MRSQGSCPRAASTLPIVTRRERTTREAAPAGLREHPGREATLIVRVYSLINSDPLRRDLRSEAQRDDLIGEGGGQFQTAK